MPEQDKPALQRMPLSPKEKEALQNQDKEALESDLWGWYPFLYRDAGSLESGADTAFTPWQPPAWTINFPEIDLGIPEEPEIPTGSGTPAGNTYPTWPELINNLVDNVAGGAGVGITIPPCVASNLGGPETLFDAAKLPNLLGREATPGTVDLKFPTDSCQTFTGFRAKWVCYPDGSAWGVPICKDGIDVYLVSADGSESSLLNPRPQAYKGGSNPSGWASQTIAEIINFAWAQYNSSIRTNCGCE